MILIDPRDGAPKPGTVPASKYFAEKIASLGVPCQVSELPFGDFAFEGSGPRGTVSIGVERKTLHDMLRCIEDSRYSAHQKVGMSQLYDYSYLLVEGQWRPHDPEGWLMEAFNGSGWGFCKPGGRRVLYSKLYRYLISVQMSGTPVLYARDRFETAYHVCELFHWFSKPWLKHTAMLETQKLNLPDLRTKPPLVRRWAAEIEDIGVTFSIAAEKLFKTPHRLAQSTEADWMKIPGVGPKTAMKIVKEIRGWGK